MASAGKRRRILGPFDLLVAALLLLGFGLDLFTPQGYADWAFYLLALLLCARTYPRFKLAVTAFMASLFTVVGFFLSPPGGNFWASVFSSTFALVLIWAIVWVAYRWQNAEESQPVAVNHFRQLFEGSVAAVIRTHLDGTILDCNDTCAKLLGYETPEELMSKTAWDAYYQAEGRRAFIAELREKKIVTGIELCLKKKDGTPVWVLENASLLEPPGGGAPFVEGTFIDVTDRARTDEELRKSEERFRLIAESIAEVVWIASSDHSMPDYVSPAFEQIWGRPVRRLYEKPGTPLTYVHAEDRRRFLTHIDTLKAGRPSEAEYRIHRPDGSVRWIWDRGVPVRDPSATGAVRYVGVTRDITDRKQAEDEIRKLSRAMEQIPVSVVITDREGMIEYVNPKFQELTGFTPEEVRGQTPRILKSGYTLPVEYEKLWRTIRAGEEWQGVFHNKKKDGSLFWARASVSPIRDDAGTITHYLAVEEDITEHRLLEEQFRQAQKMEAVGRLAGGVAHDFNNLLTIINGYSQLLLEKQDPDNPAYEYLTQVLRAGERAASLTRQLLAFSRMQVMAPQVLDLNEVVRNMQKMVHRLIGENIELAVRLADSLGHVRVDPAQIEQVILNLVVNAADAMPEGGKLMFETANVELDESYARHRAIVTPGPYVMLAVSDTGMGIDSQTQEHIFEPFFTTKEKGKGTGLGLATVYGIVKQSGGYIWVYSQHGKGTSFKVYLPQVDEEAESLETRTQGRHIPRGTETVLLVEDEEAVRALAARVLQEHGYRVLESNDADEAVRMGAQYPERIHLLLTDVVMPKLSGRHVAERLASARPDIKVLYISGYAYDAALSNGGLSKDTFFLQKPFTPESLARKVRETLDAPGPDGRKAEDPPKD